MKRFNKIATWSQGLDNVFSATPLVLLYTCSLGDKKYLATLELCLFLQNQCSPVLGSHVTFAMDHSDASIPSPLISE